MQGTDRMYFSPSYFLSLPQEKRREEKTDIHPDPNKKEQKETHTRNPSFSQKTARKETRTAFQDIDLPKIASYVDEGGKRVAVPDKVFSSHDHTHTP